jgi:hypothetical protein
MADAAARETPADSGARPEDTDPTSLADFAYGCDIPAK